MLSYKPLFYFGVGLVICCIGSAYYGYNSGKEYVEGLRAKDKAEYLNQINLIQQDYKQKEVQYNEKISIIKKEYEFERASYIESLSRIQSTYSNKLQESEQRALLYKRKASNTKGCSSIADISGRLDRTLTEGISLVRELRDTLKLRESQIKVLKENYEGILKVINDD